MYVHGDIEKLTKHNVVDAGKYNNFTPSGQIRSPFGFYPKSNVTIFN